MFRLARLCRQSRGPSTPSDVLAACRTLGVGPTATLHDIKANYKKMAATCHPDVPGGNEATMKSVNAAYELLRKNPPKQPTQQRQQSTSSGHSCNQPNKFDAERAAYEALRRFGEGFP